jgi:MFS family permease
MQRAQPRSGSFWSRLSLREAHFGRDARLFLLSTLIDGIGFSGSQLFFNFYILSLGHSREFLGLLNTIPFFTGLVLGLPLGALSDRIGHRRAMLLGLTLMFSMFAVVATTPSTAILVAAIAIYGLGSTLYYLSTTPFMAGATTTEDRPYLFSLNVAMQTLASAAGSLLAGFLPGWFGGVLAAPADGALVYRAVLLTSLAAGSLSIVPLFLMRDQKAPAGASAQMTTLRRVSQALALPVVRQLALPNLLIGIGAAVLIPYMNVFFKERFAISDSLLGLLFSLSAIITAVGTFLGPRLALRLGSKIRAVVATQGLSIVFLLLLGFWPGLVVAAVAYLIRAALMNMAAPLYSAYGMERAPLDQRALVSSVLYLTWQTGWAFGPYLSGYVQEHWGFSPLFVTTAVVYVLAVAATWAFFHSSEEVHPVDDPGAS